MLPINAPPIITLTTDFGVADHYVGTVKGVLLSRCQGAQLIDITHELPPFSIYSGAYAIDQAARYFPPGTVHLVVVDPGVGTARKPLLVEASGQYFVAPDNGVLSFILAGDSQARAHAITRKELWLETLSRTFHGRDIFAPVAAALAAGQIAPEQVGPAAGELETLPDIEAREVERGLWQGRVLSIDRFGNVITSFRSTENQRLTLSRGWRLTANVHQVTEFRRTFGEAEPGLCFVYTGSSGYLEIGMNRASAARELELEAGGFLELKTHG